MNCAMLESYKTRIRISNDVHVTKQPDIRRDTCAVGVSWLVGEVNSKALGWEQVPFHPLVNII